MSKHQYVEDGKVYEADKDTGEVTEIGNAPSRGYVDSFWDTVDRIPNVIGENIDEALNPSSTEEK